MPAVWPPRTPTRPTPPPAAPTTSWPRHRDDTSANFAETNTAKTTGDTLSLVSGTPQSTTVNTAFTTSGRQGRRPVRQLGLGRDRHLHSPRQWRLGHLHHLGHRGHQSNGLATSNAYKANTTAGSYNVVASAPGATPVQLRHDQQPRFGPHGHRHLGVRPERDGQHSLHQPAGGHGHRPVRQPRLGRHGHLHSPRQWRLGHLHHLGHRGHQCQRRGHLEHLHGQHHRRRALQRRGLGTGRPPRRTSPRPTGSP